MLEESEVRTIGKYEILGPLGRGSMGLVYKGRDPEIGRLVAIKTLRKLLPTHMQSADMALERFRNEARSAGNLRHPHIITIFEVSRDGDTPYIVMDYVEGQSLEGVLEKEQTLSLDRTLHYLAQVAQGLDYAHEKGVIHKDIKPGNIFVDKSHNVFILDFGIATISESMTDGHLSTGPTLGTPGYMSPEQILSERIDARTDLFSLAIVAFECLTGQRPFPGATFTEVVGNILNAKPLSLTGLMPGLPLALEAEFERALSKEKTARHSTAREMIEAFAAAAGVAEKPGKGFLRPQREDSDAAWTTPTSGAYSSAPRSDLLVTGGQYSSGAGRGREALRTTGGWPLAENPGDMFEHDNRLVVGLLSASKFSPIQAVTFLLGAVAVVMALVLFYQIFQPPAPPPVAVESGAPGSTEPAAAVSQNGALVAPEVESAPAGLPVDALTNKQLLGVLLSAATPEGLLLDALRESYARKVPQLVDTCVELLQHDSYVVRIEAIKTVALLGDRRIVPRLMQSLDDHDPLVRGQAAKALGTLGDRGALGYLSQRMVSEEVPEVKAAIRASIEKINGFPLKDPA